MNMMSIGFSILSSLVQVKRQDRLHSGLLEVTETQQGVFVTWDRTKEISDHVRNRNIERNSNKVIINDQGNVAMCVGSPPSADWAVIADNLQDPTTPIGQIY